MILKIENYHSYFKENYNYNIDISAFITELLETNSFGRIGYKISELNNFTTTKRHYYFNQAQNRKEYLKPQIDDHILNNFLKYEYLGPLEFSLASYLLNPNIEYDVFVLTGALGSGKSSLSNYTLDFIENSNLTSEDLLHFPKSGLIHRVNFNEHFNSDNKYEIVEEFKLLLISKVTSLVESIHKNELFINNFIEIIDSKKNERYNLFSDYSRKLRNSNLKTEEQKFDFLLNWLNNFDSNLSYKLRLISYLLAFIKEFKGNAKKVDFIILFDNIDKLNDDAQMEILNIIFSFSIKLNIKILVPMRLTTFGKIKGNGSYSFAVFQNTGQLPVSIFGERIKHFLANKEEYNLDTKVSKEYHSDLISKIDFINTQLLDDTNLNRLTNFFTSISGNSIRRGLFISERFFVNSAFSYKDKTLYQDEFLKALLVADTENCKMYGNDRLINNIFSTTENNNSLLKVRILQILDFFRENNWVCKMSLILSQISLFEEYSNEEILDAINDLITYTRRLVYIEGVKEYTDYSNLSQSMNDVVHITYSGIEYLNTLIYNTVFLQTAFIGINWKIPNSFKNIDYLRTYVESVYETDKSSSTLYLKNVIENKKFTITDFLDSLYDYRETKERMKLLRNCLYLLMLNDLNQITIYYENNNVHNIESIEDRYIKNSIIIDIIGKTSISVFNILKTGHFNKSEIENWYNLLILSNLWHKAIFKFDNKIVNNSVELYETELRNK
ncbi:hypothetical protein [Chryseobacterium gambrini]|uniref:KAP family P-loop domain-containing protein n=2 Tax=Chryseobacterium TaxID=59732 RepID=A0ABN7CAF0_9FLAO|nr:hypothetical protein CRDW_06920 [Chryseobacterium gambrini]